MIAIGYVQAALFLATAAVTIGRWRARRGRSEGHLALAAGLFGTGQLLSAVTATLYQAAKGEQAPRVVSVTSGTITFLAVWAFLLFLSDFVPFPRWARAFFAVATVANIVLSVIERPDLKFVGGRIVRLGVHNPINYTAYITYVLAYLAVAFGILWLAFTIYGLRIHGLARARMLMLGTGFFVLTVAIGLIPRLLFGRPSTRTINDLTLAVRILALASAPLLFMGFAMPRFLSKRFSARNTTEAA